MASGMARRGRGFGFAGDGELLAAAQLQAGLGRLAGEEHFRFREEPLHAGAADGEGFDEVLIEAAAGGFGRNDERARCGSLRHDAPPAASKRRRARP